MADFNYSEAPKDGYILAYFRKCIIFEKYSIRDGKINSEKFCEVPKEQMLELHMFDQDSEYRVIRRQDGSYIENIIRDSNSDKKIEHLALEEKCQTVMKELTIINYLSYDESGMISINNYRIAPGRE